MQRQQECRASRNADLEVVIGKGSRNVDTVGKIRWNH